MSAVSFFFLVLSLNAFATESATVPAGFGLEKLEPGTDFDSGCGCSLTNTENAFLFFSGIENHSPAIVRTEGERKELKWLSSTRRAGRLKLGERFEQTYGDGHLKLNLKYKTTFVCGKNDEGCEVER